MHQMLNQVVSQFKASRFLYLSALKDVPSEVEFTRPNGNGNSMNWVAGHIATYRYSIGRTLGLKDETPWPKLYDIGSDVQDVEKYPSLSEIVTVSEEFYPTLTRAFEDATEELLLSEGPWAPPEHENTRLGIVSFLALHEAYHAGQLLYIRSVHGLPKAYK